MFSHDDIAYISPWRQPKAVCGFADFLSEYKMIGCENPDSCAKCGLCDFYRLPQGA
jgi:hypothetical protein